MYSEKDGTIEIAVPDDKQVLEKGHSRACAKGPELRCLSILDKERRLKNNYLHNCPQYIKYEQWNEHGYYSDQFKEELQKKMWQVAFSINKAIYWNVRDYATGATKYGRYTASGKKALIEPPRSLQNITLYPVDIERDFLDDFVVIYFGRRRSGKTYDERYVLYHLRHRYPLVYVVTGTKLNCFWSQYVPKEFIYDIEELEEFAAKLFKRQEWLKDNNDKLGIDPRVLLVLDDVLGDKYLVRYSKTLSKIWKNGRHYDVSVHITLQDVRGVPPDLRDNTDIAIFFRILEGGRKKVVGEEWLSSLGKEYHDEFLWDQTGLLDPNTGLKLKQDQFTTDDDRAGKPPKALVINQARYSENLLDIFKSIVGKDPGPFMLGKVDYYVASITGNYRALLQTDPRFRKKTRVTKLEEVMKMDVSSNTTTKERLKQ